MSDFSVIFENDENCFDGFCAEIGEDVYFDIQLRFKLNFKFNPRFQIRKRKG